MDIFIKSFAKVQNYTIRLFAHLHTLVSSSINIISLESMMHFVKYVQLREVFSRV